MRKILGVFLILILAASTAQAFSFGGKRFETVTPEGDTLRIPLSEISDSKAHFFRVDMNDGKYLEFFTVRSEDGLIRAAVDACDVCYRAGKGYVKKGDVMVCENCGMRFPLSRINVVKGGCNPAPLKRQINGETLEIAMSEVAENLWYMEYRR